MLASPGSPARRSSTRRPSATTCVWWQSRAGRAVAKERWIEKAEDDWGAWGALYHDDDGRLLGSMQYGAGALFPRAAELPAGPPSDDAVLVTCAYLVAGATPVGRAVALPRRDRRGAGQGREGARGVRLPLSRRASRPTSASSSTARSSRATSSPTSASARFGPRAGSSSPGSSSAGCCRSPRASARRCCGSSRRRSRPRRCRSALRRLKPPRACRASRSSAIWIAFSAAPLRRLSHDDEEREAVLGRRVVADPADEHVVAARCVARASGTASSLTPGRRAEDRGRLLRRERLLGLDPDRLGVPDEHRHADARRAQRQRRAARGSCASPRAASPPRRTRRRRSPSPCPGRARPAARPRSRSIACAPAPETDW